MTTQLSPQQTKALISAIVSEMETRFHVRKQRKETNENYVLMLVRAGLLTADNFLSIQQHAVREYYV